MKFRFSLSTLFAVLTALCVLLSVGRTFDTMAYMVAVVIPFMAATFAGVAGGRAKRGSGILGGALGGAVGGVLAAVACAVYSPLERAWFAVLLPILLIWGGIGGTVVGILIWGSVKACLVGRTDERARKKAEKWGMAGVFTMLTGLLVLASYEATPPLLHFRATHFPNDPTPNWRLIRPTVDRHGNVGFMDYRYNMVAVVVTGESLSIPPSPKVGKSHAVLFKGTAHEVRVTAQRNTLLIIRRGDMWAFDIPPGTARQWNGELIHIYATGDNLLDEIAAKYDGADRKSLEALIQRVRTDRRHGRIGVSS